jgi:periplasmic protein TonB
MSTNKHFRVYVPKIIGGLILVVAIIYLVRVISGFITENPVKHEKKIQPITLLKPPPPPPPPPPPKEEPPPEPEVQEKIEEPEPEPEPLPDVPDQQPAGDTGLDAEGTAGSDAFGLVGRKGGKGLLGGGSPYAWYAGTIKDSLIDILSEHDELRRKSYSAVVKIWLNPDGSVTRYELARGSNDPEIDKLLNKLLAKFRKAKEAPPAGMEQPVKLKISSRL